MSNQFVLLNGQAFPANTEAQINDIEVELHSTGVQSVPVWSGDPEGDHVDTGQFVFAPTPDPSQSCDFPVHPADSRCRYWAKIIRAGNPLPLPSAVSGANDVPGPYLRNGEEELFVGDVAIEGEANHHRKARGWTYHVYVCTAAGRLRKLTQCNADVKQALRDAGERALLPGSGDVAACVRKAHAYRLGLLGTEVES